MKRSVIAIGLDAADPQLLETWMSQGHLKNLNQLRQTGVYGRLSNFDAYRAETPWTTFLTGTLPETTGYWGPVHYDPKTYTASEVGAYKFDEYPPFYALGENYRVAVLDMPQTALTPQANGPQVLAWGAHSPQVKSQSMPATLFEEVVQKHGRHPVLNRDYAETRNPESLQSLQRSLQIGITRRAAICRDWLQQEPWDFFLTVFGETHSAGHYLWHMSQPHPIHKLGNPAAPDALLEVHEVIDQAIGEIVDAAPDNADILVFAAHGMGSNVMDLPSVLFLPEFLYRWNFPGRAGLAKGKPGAPLPPAITAHRKRGWIGDVWDLKYEANPLRSWLRRNLPTKWDQRLDALFKSSTALDLESPYAQLEKSESLFWQAANWYKPFWKQMKAFALPSYSEGYVRINLKGREAEGIVEPEEYSAVCDEISAALRRLVDARTGKPMVAEIIRTRQSAADEHDRLPSADLIVLWQEETASDVVDSPDIGRIGPVPFLRTGSHRADGFLVASGPRFAPGVALPSDVKAVDLAPTILDLLDAPIPDYFAGRSLLPQISVQITA